MATLWALVACWCCCTTAIGGEIDKGIHPVDGPHADLRLSVTDEGVRFGISMNLAYLDDAAPFPRESLGSIIGPERDALREAALAHVLQGVVVKIDGRKIEPRLEQYELFADPDQVMATLYPNYGSRALITAVLTLVYPSPGPQSIEVTWPHFPKDVLAAAIEGLTPEETPPTYMPTQFRAQGRMQMVRLSAPEPTFRWTASDEDSPLASLPEPPEQVPPAQIGLLRLLSVPVLLVGVGTLVAARTRVAGGVLLVCGTLAMALGGSVAMVDIPGSKGKAQPLPEPEASAIFTALHEHMYRAFDYTAESEIYDALEQAIDGPLLESTYTELFTMLLQTEQEGAMGVVTAIDPVETTITPKPQNPIAFEVRHRWRVDGTVYHWGHSHTRTHEYDAKFAIEPRASGWRIVRRQILSQERVDTPDATPLIPPPPVQAPRMLPGEL